MSSTRSLPIARFVGEFFVIVVGVLVALGVDQWRQSVETRDLVEETLRQLAAEIAENDGLLVERMTYRREVLPALDSLHDSVNAGGRVLISIDQTLPEGLGTTPLRSTAWQLASMTESARHFELALLSFLSVTYSVQEQVLAFDRVMNDGVIRPEWFGADDQTGPIIFLAVTMNNLLEQEENLRRHYAEALRIIREQLGDPDAGAAIRIT